MLSNRLARQIFLLRSERGWSLDELARLCGLSRASLSRIENNDVSPTADSLHKICTAFDMPVSRLMAMTEDSFAALVPYDAQVETTDPDTGVTRRHVSPPARGLIALVIEDHLPPNTDVSLASPSNADGEHHLIMLDGELSVTRNAAQENLTAGDCLRFHPDGDLSLSTPATRGARYLLVSL